METFVQYLLLALALASVQISFTESRLNEKRRDKTERRHHARDYVEENICDIGDRDSIVHCYCNNNEVQTANRADCWVFSGGLHEDDHVWTLFSKQTNIERLSFNVRFDGALNFIPLNVIHRLKLLQKLSITYANLFKIEKKTFSNLTLIREIKLMKNEIVELDFSAFTNLPALENLTLKENKIAEIQRDVFVDLPNLRYVDLSSNNITIAHDGCFEHLPQLNDLRLESNSILYVSTETFSGLANLKRLDLRSNKLNMINKETFSELSNLNELLLDNNEIPSLMPGAFDGLSMLQKLSLTGNKITHIYRGTLTPLTGLELLDLRNNELQFFDYEALTPILENFLEKSSVLYLSGNKFVCDCHLTWIKTLRNETRSDPLQLALDEVTCKPHELDAKKTHESDLVIQSHIEELEEMEEIEEEFRIDSENNNNLNEKFKPSAQPIIGNQLFVVNLPSDLLCPQKSNGEDSLMLSSKDKSYWDPNPSSQLHSSLSLVFSIPLISCVSLVW